MRADKLDIRRAEPEYVKSVTWDFERDFGIKRYRAIAERARRLATRHEWSGFLMVGSNLRALDESAFKANQNFFEFSEYTADQAMQLHNHFSSIFGFPQPAVEKAQEIQDLYDAKILELLVFNAAMRHIDENGQDFWTSAAHTISSLASDTLYSATRYTEFLLSLRELASERFEALRGQFELLASGDIGDKEWLRIAKLIDPALTQESWWELALNLNRLDPVRCRKYILPKITSSSLEALKKFPAPTGSFTQPQWEDVYVLRQALAVKELSSELIPATSPVGSLPAQRAY